MYSVPNVEHSEFDTTIKYMTLRHRTNTGLPWICNSSVEIILVLIKDSCNSMYIVDDRWYSYYNVF